MVSISIVSYNNINIVSKCIDSIQKYTVNTEYEIILVAYKFDNERLMNLRDKYPFIKIIENNRTCGFGENHNLALKHSTGEYLMILNDDTYITTDIIGGLIKTFKENDQISILSPCILNEDGTVQINGRRPYSLYYYVFSELRLFKIFKCRNKYENKRGLFNTFNISGSCFIIKSETFRKLGGFDEYYFFSPEDIALSTRANKERRCVFVNSDIFIYHLGSATANLLQTAILPVTMQGIYYFFSTEYNKIVEYFVRSISSIISFYKIIFWICNFPDNYRNIMIRSHINILRFAFKKVPPKSLFQFLIKTQIS